MNYFKKHNLIIGWFTFAVSAVVYLMTMEPTASFWDCAEFIATSYKLEVGHPPGSPLFMMIARFFTLFAPSKEYVALMVNTMSSLASGFTILFLFWSITHLGRKIYGKAENELTSGESWTVLGAGLIGALAYTFTDTFWFSAIEGEVYALSSMFTALVFWAILKWEDVADQPHANRWLVLIAYLMGLSIGIHILNLLTIPALVFVYYFRKYPKTTRWGVIKAILASGMVLGFVYIVMISWSVAIGAWFDKLFVNAFGLPVNSGITFFALAAFALAAWGIWHTYKHGKVLANTIILCATVILLGYSSYASVIIRAQANPPMNSNDPSNPYALLSLLNREQYGNRPLIKGHYYSSPMVGVIEKPFYFLGESGKYEKGTTISGYEYAPGFEYFFPRMYSNRDSHVQEYKRWVTGNKVPYRDEVLTVPTFGENMRYFFAYQLNFMYWRYFLWNFVGRQSDVQSTGEITDGYWLSGIKAIDQLYLGPQDNLPSEMAANKGRNQYYFLPFILGLIGLIWQLGRDKRNFFVVLWLFFMMGIALVLYFNTTPGEPRERDYVFAGAFYAYCMWIGFGVMALAETFKKITGNRLTVATAGMATAVCACVPIILAAENWDDHDRSHRYVVRDVGFNYLQSAIPNAIVMNYGDNDTFPLWYNQEVEEVRTDIRVMNMSYLGAEWYINQMKIKVNESEPVPFSLPRSKYTNRNEYLFVEDMFKRPVDAKAAIEFLKNEDPRTKLPLSNNRTVDYLPAKVLAVPVNRENAIVSGIVKAEDAHLMEDTIYISIQKQTIERSEMMLIDLLANFEWKRPLYFTQTLLVRELGLRDYLQFDGFAYRLVPIKTPVRSQLEVGRIDPEYLYDKLMNTFRYGNVKDPRVYADFFIQTTFNAAQTRNAFARLAVALVEQGDSIRAVEVLDRAVEEMPFAQIRHSYILTIPIIEAYYRAGAYDKGNAVLEDYARILREYILYYSQFTGGKREMVSQTLHEKITLLGELYNIARENRQQEQVDGLDKFFLSLGIE